MATDNITSPAQQEAERIARLRGVLTPGQFGQQQQQRALQGGLGVQLGDINRSALQNLVGGTSALSARGLGGGISAGNLASITRARQSALGDLQLQLSEQGRLAEEEERLRQNTFNALVSSINTSNLGDPAQRQLLNQQLQQAIQAGAVTPREQSSLNDLLSGRVNRLDDVGQFGLAGLNIDPNQLGQASFGEELVQGLTGKGGQGLGGFLGDTLTFGIPGAVRSVGDIAQGEGNLEDYLNIALTLGTLPIGGFAGKGASVLGRKLLGTAGKEFTEQAGKRALTTLAKGGARGLLGRPLARVGASTAQAGLRGLGSRALLGSGVRSLVTPRIL